MAGGGAQIDVWVEERSIERSGPYWAVRERTRFHGKAANGSVKAIETRALYDYAQQRVALKSMSYFADRHWATTPSVTTVEDGQEEWSAAAGVNTLSAMKLEYVCSTAGG